MEDQQAGDAWRDRARRLVSLVWSVFGFVHSLMSPGVTMTHLMAGGVCTVFNYNTRRHGWMTRLLLFVSLISAISLALTNAPRPAAAVEEPPSPGSFSHGAIVLSDYNEILYDKNANVRVAMASTTKMMTAIVAVRYGRLDTPVLIDESDIVGEASMGLTAGTTVTLRGPHTDGTDDTHAAETPDTVETWRHRDFLGLFVVGAVLMVVYGLLALATAENARSTFVVVLCFVAALAIGLTAAFAPAHWTRLPWIIAPACGGVCWMGIVNLRDPYDAGWACWFVGALNATVVLLVGRFRLSAAVIAVVAAGTGVCLGQLHQGVAVNGGMVASLLPQMAAFALASWGVRKAIDMATEAMNASAAEVGRLRLADARAEEAARVAQSRSQDVIVQAGHLLERIAVAEPLSDPDRDRCRLAEAEARD
ncbi:MAG TPA: hypothetical protein DCX80_06680, partial [Chloroflexi bacterium]|nr:hypothetical protein [Chloroflexota bacterium]